MRLSSLPPAQTSLILAYSFGGERGYWDTFTLEHSVRAAFPGADLDEPCPFSESMQQLMRNIAMPGEIEQESGYAIEKAWFALRTHDGSPVAAEHLGALEAPLTRCFRGSRDFGIGCRACW